MLFGVRPFFTMGLMTFLLALLSIVGAGYIGIWSIGFYQREFPKVDVLKTQYPVVHYIGRHQHPEIVLEVKRPLQWKSLSQISKIATAAIVVSEDWAFYQHKGYDPNQIIEAIKKDWKDSKYARGASTITQQVARNVFLSQDKRLWRKLREIYLATEMEESLGKNRILEIYLNIAEWGEGLYGIGPASKFYFNKTPDQLNAKEGAFLAMLLPSPKRYSMSYRNKKLTKFAKETVESILVKMVQAHFLTENEMTQVIAVPLSFEAADSP